MEIQFKQREQDLRQKDNELQASLIQFASYLDGNQKAMDKCDKNIEKLKIENEELAMLRKVFLELDKSQDGFLQPEEIEAGLETFK